MTREDLLNLIPAYAIGALDDDEQIALENLLQTDAEAQERLQDYTAIADILTFAVPERPAPAHLKADLKARLAARPKIVPKDTPVQNITPSKSPGLLSFTSVAIASAAILLLVLGFWFVMTQLEPQLAPNEGLFNEIVAQANIDRFAVAPVSADDASGELVVASGGEQSVLRIASLPDISEDQSYQLWVITGDTVQSIGIFHWTTGHGPYFVPIQQPITEIGTIAMTIEPFEGSPLGNEPTGDILFGVEVAS